jgi:Xaa-Pro aminopeptidase
MSSGRIESLAARLEAPLLVTDLTNLAYLTGLESSNAALVVQPKGGATLYTDFRYIETAREVDGVDVKMTKRAILTDIRESLPKRLQFEADALPYAQFLALDEGKAELIPTRGIVEELRAVKSD